MHSSLKKGLSWILSYGIIFSLPAGALLSRFAYAGTDEGGAKSPKPKTESPKPSAETPKPASKKSLAQPAKASTEDKSDEHKKSDSGESVEPLSKEGKPSAAPRTKDCLDPEFLMRATDSTIGAGRRCDKMQTPPLDTRHCWYQFFELLGAAQTNALIAHNSLEQEKASQQAAAATITNGNYIIPSLFQTGKVKSVGPKEDELKKVFIAMSDDTIQNKKECCLKLAQQAEEVSSWILKTEDKESKVKPESIQKLVQEQKASCEQKKVAHAAAPAAGAIVTQTSEAPEKKKSIWPAVFWGLAAGTLLFFLLYKRKKRNSSPPPTPPTPPASTTGGGTTYPVLTTTTTGRDITTGGTGGLTYPSDITGTSTGRDITTGGTGTVTGSTTATTTTSTSTTTTGSTTASPTYPDLSTSGTTRTTGGTTRTISK
jgi:hypothetical protein